MLCMEKVGEACILIKSMHDSLFSIYWNNDWVQKGLFLSWMEKGILVCQLWTLQTLKYRLSVHRRVLQKINGWIISLLTKPLKTAWDEIRGRNLQVRGSDAAWWRCEAGMLLAQPPAPVFWENRVRRRLVCKRRQWLAGRRTPAGGKSWNAGQHIYRPVEKMQLPGYFWYFGTFCGGQHTF